jgi:hypothetical protein
MKTWIKRTIGISALSLAALAVGAPRAEAGTQNQTFTVQTTLDAACTFTTNNLTFPNYTTGSAFIVNGSTNFTVTCPGASAGSPTPVTLTMAPTGGAFAMTGGTGTLTYKLCNDAACTQVYANNVAGPSQSIATGAGQAYTLFGQIPAAQAPAVAAGTVFTQQVTATLTY